MTTRNPRIRFMHNNFVTASNITAKTAEASFPVTNLANNHRHKVYTPTSMSAQWILVDLGVPYAASFVALVPQLGDKFPVSQGGQVRIQADNFNTASVWASPSLDLTMSHSDLGAFRFQDDQTGSYAYRYWRYYIDDSFANVGSIAHAYVGDYLTITTRNIVNGFVAGTVDPSIVQDSDSGSSFYVSEKTRYQMLTGGNVLWIPRSQRQDLQQFVHDVGICTPFYISIDPTLVVSDSIDEWTRRVRFNGQTPAFPHFKGDVFSMVGIEMREA